MSTETTAQESVAQEPAQAKSSAKTAASKKRISKKPVPKKSAVKKKVAKKRTTKKSAAKKPVAAKESTARRPTAMKTRAKKRKPKKRTPSNDTTKAQSIRDTAKELGKKARPRHIIAALAAKGITVASAQVSTTLKTAGLRRGRRRKKVETTVGPKTSANGHAFNINELVKVKDLAEELGGTARLKELAAALERLM